MTSLIRLSEALESMDLYQPIHLVNLNPLNVIIGVIGWINFHLMFRQPY